jgi:nascent polypeptide-associated complex subunit alpha
MSFVEEVADADHHQSGHVHGPNCSHGHDDHEEVQNIHGRMVLNRNEKKARAELLKLGLKPIAGIHRVTFVRGKTIFAISEPEVYKNPTSDSYIVFGEARVEDPGFQAQMAAAQRMVQQATAQAAQNKSTSTTSQADDSATATATEEDEEEESAEGLNESDIKIVMDQANVSRSKAIKSLKEHDNDVVNTIMDLSM